MIVLLSVINLKSKKIFYFLIVCLIGIVLFLPLLGDYATNIHSIFDNKAQEEVGGSNAEMRFKQLAAAIALMEQSPIVGLGFKFLNEMDNALTVALLGMESMWFRILTQFGLLGVIANLYYAYYSLYIIPRHFKSKSVFFLSVAYWLVASATSVPGMLMYMYFLFIIIFIKLSPSYQKMVAYE